MKKLLIALVLVSFLGLMITPVVALAAAPPAEVTKCKMRHDLTGSSWTDAGFTCPAKGSDCEFTSPTNTCGSCCVLDTIYTVTDWIFIIVIAISAIMIIMGAFNIITAGGTPEKVSTGRSYIIYAIVGLIVALLAKAIPAIARSILGM